MRKIFFLSLLFLSILLVPNASNATHIMGGEITWECDANGRYDFRVSVYRDCSGNAVPVRGHLYIHNYPSVGVVTLIAKNNNPAGATNTSDIYSSVVGDTIKPNCRTGATYICGNGGGDPEAVFVENIEVNNVKLNGRPPLGGWIITYSDVARNPNDNISGQPGITLRAKMFSSSATVNDTCVDNSPVFREEATSLLCLGSAFTYNHNASDAELDSLVYEWARPLGDLFNSNRDGFFGNPDPLPSLFVEGSTPSNVGFDFRTGGTGRYTFDSPFPNSSQDVRNVAAVLDQNTGEISLECYTSGKYVSVVKVSAYKCGEKVAEIYRELQSNINANCATLNNEPTIRPPFLDPSNNFTLFNDTVNAGDLVTFNIQVTDFDFITDSSVIPPVIRFDTVTLEASGLQFGTNYTSSTTGCPNPPCATLTSSLPQSSQSGVNSSFRWQTDCNHVAFSDGCVSLSNTYTFVVRATDNSCPIPAQNIATISVTVLADSVIQSPLINCLDVKNNGDVELDWNTTPNIGNSFTAWMIYSATNKNGPYSLVDSVKTYNTTTYTHVGANADDQQRWYFMRSRSGCKGQIQNVSRDTVSTIFVDFQENNADLDVIWNPLGDPNPVGSSNQYRVSKAYPVTGGLSFYQNTMDTTINETFAVCSDTVQYRVELVNTAEACTSRSNLAGFRFEFAQPQTNFSFPANPCPNTSIAFTNLTTISSGTITYSWDFDDGSPVSTTENPSHTFTLPGSYDVTLTATSSLGCDSIFIQTLDVDFPDADAGTDIAICTAGSTQIGGSPTTTAGNTITWSPATGLSSTSVANPTATPTTTTTYTVTVTEPSGCSNTDQITVTVNSIPTADAGLDQTICSGDNASLGGSPTGPVGATYQWDNVASLSSGTAANPTATPTATTTYSVTVTSGVNCTATDQVTITVDPLPTADAGLDQTICDGDNA
ncbi:MAG: PKD domain-containing protein, partial [Vicingaceae bacterium]